jgi:hypothetical protein
MTVKAGNNLMVGSRALPSVKTLSPALPERELNQLRVIPAQSREKRRDSRKKQKKNRRASVNAWENRPGMGLLRSRWTRKRLLWINSVGWWNECLTVTLMSRKLRGSVIDT